MKRLLLVIVAMLMAGSHIRSQSIDSLDIMIGQMIMVGIGDFNTLDKTAPIFSAIDSGYTGGIILFEKNINRNEPKENLKQILKYAQSKSEIPLFVSIDEEGGRVNRLKPKYGFPSTKTAQDLGNIQVPDSTFAYAAQTAAILYDLGINMNFAPVVDVNVNPQNPVIGSLGRSFSADPDSVAIHAQAVVKAHDLFGVITVLKHFPGHGSSKNDSHLGLADVSDTWKFKELVPYFSLLDSGYVRAIMTAHIVNDILDESKLPATLSAQVISNVLRGMLKYNGVVISDDMQMKAISARYGLEDAIKKSINAGVDIVLFANNVPEYDLVTAGQIHQIIKKLVVDGDIDIERIKSSYNRIIQLKQDILPSQ